MGNLKLQRRHDSAYLLQFLLGIVTISFILSHKIPKYTITNTIYPDWRSTIAWLRSVFKQYFDDWLVLFRQQFFIKHKKIISQQTRKGSCLYDATWNEDGGSLNICHMFADQILLFLNKRSIVCFCRWRERRGSQNW